MGEENLRAMIEAAGSPALVETPGPKKAMRADIEFVRQAIR